MAEMVGMLVVIVTAIPRLLHANTEHVRKHPTNIPGNYYVNTCVHQSAMLTDTLESGNS